MQPDKALEQIRTGYRNLVAMRDEATAKKAAAAAQCLDQKVRAAGAILGGLQRPTYGPAELEDAWVAVASLNSKAFLCL
jgi:hypothetical protein